MHRGLEQLLIGRALAERYLLEAVLGHGGMSVVFRALDRTLGRPVALKLIQQPPGTDRMRDDLRRRFRREAGAAARIPPHPNVVQIYDYGTDAELDLDFIVMELLEGRDLAETLERGPPPRKDSARILLQAALGIAAGHRAGVLHRDIKPGNIFLVDADRGGARVLDFGIAKVLEAEGEEELTVFGHRPYSPAYASPEQLDPGRSLTPASDVYQLGLVGYEMLAGAKPYTPAEREVLRDGNSVPLPVRGNWAEVPDALRTVIARALHLDPPARYPDAAAFAHAWAAAAQEAGELTDTLPSPPGHAPAGAGLPLDADDHTLAGEPPGDRHDETLFAPDAADMPGLPTTAEQRDETLFAPDAADFGSGIRSSDPGYAPDPHGKAAVRRAGRWRHNPALYAAGAVLMVAGVVWVTSELLDGPDSPPDPLLLEMEDAFRELESEASRRLERAGTWER